MNQQEIRESILEVTRAIENVNRVFEKRAAELREAGDAQGLQQWTKACSAMRDSGNIYITWARHYAQLTEPSGASEEEGGFLDEGAVWDENPSGP